MLFIADVFGFEKLLELSTRKSHSVALVGG